MQVMHWPDPEKEIRRKFEALKPYPYGNGYSWQEFLLSQRGKEGLFMLVVERGLAHREMAFSPHREHLFGICADRTDGRFGRGCFGWATTDFGGSEKKPYEDVFIVDGYDPKFLHTYDFSSDGKREMLNAPHRQYKIVQVVESEDEVVGEIVKFARRFISSGVPTAEQAAVLARSCRILEGILDEKPCAGLKDVHKEVALKVRERWNFLQAENDDLKEKVKANENEMDVLIGFAPELD